MLWLAAIRHNEIRDLTANLLTEVCSSVCVESEVQPLSGEALDGRTANREEGACLDIAANGLWGGRYERCYMDVRIFNPHAPTNANMSISNCYESHERVVRSGLMDNGSETSSTAPSLHLRCLPQGVWLVRPRISLNALPQS